MRTRNLILFFIRFLFLLAVAILMISASQALFTVAWGEGDWLGQFLLRWGIAFFGFVAASLAGWGALAAWLIRPEKASVLLRPLVSARKRIGWMRWPIILLFACLPVWLFQYSLIGLVFLSPALRLIIWIACVLVCAYLLVRDDASLFTWPSLLTGILFAGGAILFAFPLSEVSRYPFSLDWSEGNRLWDYSILFGRERYIYPPGQDVNAFIDFGRQFIGGLPFLIPSLTIMQARLWLGLMSILPYLALALIVFARREQKISVWLLAGLWGYAFLRQGPIHTPLVFAAILVALAWKRPAWLSALLVCAATIFAASSRFTWVFAPAMWIGMLILLDSPLELGSLPRAAWMRAILLACAGLVGGASVFLVRRLDSGSMVASGLEGGLSRQPLLWYRLLPNDTLGPGILLLLLLATVPVVICLVYLVRSSRWSLNGWQRLAILASLTAFLVVGLIASTKIGGGGDLHNLDMFLLGLFFAAGAAWDRIGHRWVIDSTFSTGMKIALVLMLTLPVYFPLINMRPLLTTEVFPSLEQLTDARSPRDVGLLPLEEDTRSTLWDLRRRALQAQPAEILFIDQRQLLTFGHIQVPLVAEYEKKFLMDRAMTDSEAGVFEAFYADLAAHRFALIITEPLRSPIQGQEYVFGEENDAWVKWVSSAILCYYELDKIYPEVRIQVLAPRRIPIECNLPIP